MDESPRRSRARSLLLSLGIAIAAFPVGHPVEGSESTSAAAPTTAGDAAAASTQFAVWEYRVLGNTVLPVRDIEALLYPMLGPGKQLPDVQVARAALEKLYHDRGYGTVFVDIPPQEVNNGIVRLKVTEASIHESKIDGAHYFSERDVVTAIPEAKANTVPNLTVLQQQIAAVNDQSTDRSVAPILKAGPVPGTLDLELKVSDKLPLHGSVELDDNYTADTKPLRASVSLSYGNLFQSFDQISLQYQDTPEEPGQVGVLDATYASRPFWGGETLSGYFIDSNSNVSNVGAGANGLLGKGQITGLRWNFPGESSQASTQGITLGYDLKRFRNTITPGGGSVELVTPIKYSEFSIAYVGAWRWPLLDLSLQASPIMALRSAPNSASDFGFDRYLARPNFFYLRWDESIVLHPSAGYRLTLRVAGQSTNDSLISNESYSIGGIDGVRGYLEAEELGDSAEKATIQLQSPNVSWPMTQFMNVFGFYDAGQTHLYHTLAGEPGQVFLESFGGGFNLLPTRAVNAYLIWADPRKNGTYTHRYRSRLLFSIRGAF